MTLISRAAQLSDADLLLRWTNDPSVRKNSYNSSPAKLEEHLAWLETRLADPGASILIFESDGAPVGVVRIEAKKSGEVVAGISVDAEHRGKGYSPIMIAEASAAYCRQFPGAKINAYIKIENQSSRRAFEKAGYLFAEELIVQGAPSARLVYTIK